MPAPVFATYRVVWREGAPVFDAQALGYFEIDPTPNEAVWTKLFLYFMDRYIDKYKAIPKSKVLKTTLSVAAWQVRIDKTPEQVAQEMEVFLNGWEVT